MEVRSTRRGILALAGGGLAGLIGGRLGVGRDAHAADLDPLQVGTTTTATSKTTLSTSGVIPTDGAFVVDAPNADYGVLGSGAKIGLYGKGPIGLLGEGAVGAVFAGTDTAISLSPTGTSGPPTTPSLKGDVLVDADGVMWFCVVDGTPGTWIKLSHGGVRPLASPQRPYSTTDPGAAGPLNQGERRTIPITSVVPEIPVQAVGILGNLTIHDTLGAGYVTIYPAGTAPPLTSNINWNAPGQSIANAVTVGLGAGGAVTLFADAVVPPGTPATHLILDVAAYVL
jgi:hypothetical protein